MAEKDLNKLLQELRSHDPAAKASAAQALAAEADLPTDAIIALVDATGDGAEEVREWSSAALEERAAPPALCGELTQRLAETGDAAYWSATLLGRIGKGLQGDDLTAATSALLDLIENQQASKSAQERAVWALAQLSQPPDDQRWQATLTAAAQSGDARMARLARQALDRSG